MSQLTTNRTHRAMLRTGALVASLTLVGALLFDGLAVGSEHEAPVDAPAGFGAVPLASPATFPDDVSAKFTLKYDRGRTTVANLPHGASNVLVAEVTWQPGGTSGWHTHPGPVIVVIAEGSIEVTNARDCVPRTYGSGEAFVDPGQGNVHVATNPNAAPAVAYATFFGVPAGQPATKWVPPADC
jgi:quercetin dioxygenase-like cupin family protein